MRRLSVREITTAAVILLWSLSFDFVTSIRDVRIKIPHAIRRGEKAFLKCLYELDEDDILYSVKWYRGRREFFSFTPKETPAMKVYPVPGIKVERSLSNESQLVLDNVNLATTGKYSCEVSADAPSFHTLIAAGELEVVEVPGKDPIITGIRPRYRVGDIVRGNCTLRHTKPAANLTWTINGYETNPSHIRHHKPLKDVREMETAISGIHFVVTPQHFIYGKLKIRCTASIHDVYWKSTEKSIEEERHRHNAGNNVVNSFSDDYFDLEDGNLIDRSDTYMTHIKGDVSSLNAAAAGVKHQTKANLLTVLITLTLLLHAVQQILQLCRQVLVKIEKTIAEGCITATTKTTKTCFERNKNIKITTTIEKTMATATISTTMKALSCQGDHCKATATNSKKGSKNSSFVSGVGNIVKRINSNTKKEVKEEEERKVLEKNCVVIVQSKELKPKKQTKSISIGEFCKKTNFLHLIKRKSEMQLLQGQLSEIVCLKIKENPSQKQKQQQEQQKLSVLHKKETRTIESIKEQRRAIKT